jgi:hypothetical protein
MLDLLEFLWKDRLQTNDLSLGVVLMVSSLVVGSQLVVVLKTEQTGWTIVVEQVVFRI